MNYSQTLKRFQDIIRLSSKGWSQREIGQKYGVSHQRVQQILSNGVPRDVVFTVEEYKEKRKIRDWSEYGIKKPPEGREVTRMLVRIRDKFTCQSCGKTRTPKDKGKRKLFDVHHLNGLCGKKSLGYDSIKDIGGLITLCHKCHYNHPEHSQKLTKRLSTAVV